MTWGPWIEHDGKGCPCVGEYVQVEHMTLDENVIRENIAGSNFHKWPDLPQGSWNHSNWPIASKIIRYRIRKPKGLTLLEEIAKNPERELEKV